MALAPSAPPRHGDVLVAAERFGGPRSAWREVLTQELRSAAAIAGGVWLMYSLSALGTLGRVSREFAVFSVAVLLHWFCICTAQALGLRWLRERRHAGRTSVLLRFVIVTLLGFALAPLGTIADGHAMALGLIGANTNGFRMQVVWMLAWTAAFFVFRDEGLRRQALTLQRLQQLQAAQIASRRRVAESELRALQARVDPQLFFDLLDAVQRLYAHDATRAEALLDELIVFLRAALPRLHNSASCLAQELALAESYVRCQSLARDAGVTLTFAVADETRDLAFPAGVLMPMLVGMAPHWPAVARLELAAEVIHAAGASARLSLSLTAPVALPAAPAEAIRLTLRNLYGGTADFSCRPVGGEGFQHQVSVPRETP